MPELPDITVYVEAIAARVVGTKLTGIRFASPFLLRSAVPPIREAYGQRVVAMRRLGKRIVFQLERTAETPNSDGSGAPDGATDGATGPDFLVLHLMVAGRLKWAKAGAKPPGRIGLAAFDFERGVLLLTEASTKKRASLHLVRGEEGLGAFDRGGLEPLDSSLADFTAVLRRENHTLKRSLTDPRLFSGIGNAYSDEILHRARLSPVALSTRLDAAQVKRLHAATKAVLQEWTTRLRAECGDGFPEKVTAFRPEMAMHGRFGQPCPDCGTKVQRIAHAENETNYCPTCQTGGKLLADRSLSRLLHGDWPKTLEEMEERRAAGREQVAEAGLRDEDLPDDA